MSHILHARHRQPLPRAMVPYEKSRWGNKVEGQETSHYPIFCRTLASHAAGGVGKDSMVKIGSTCSKREIRPRPFLNPNHSVPVPRACVNDQDRRHFSFTPVRWYASPTSVTASRHAGSCPPGVLSIRHGRRGGGTLSESVRPPFQVISTVSFFLWSPWLVEHPHWTLGLRRRGGAEGAGMPTTPPSTTCSMPAFRPISGLTCGDRSCIRPAENADRGTHPTSHITPSAQGIPTRTAELG